jgi:hypothetical protein
MYDTIELNGWEQEGSQSYNIAGHVIKLETLNTSLYTMCNEHNEIFVPSTFSVILPGR